jgi:D-alanyl-D-alanine carboxypeptidase/D-alanyl-D-alanine-endopeptidase (penicillin-binding protein 4)
MILSSLNVKGVLLLGVLALSNLSASADSVHGIRGAYTSPQGGTSDPEGIAPIAREADPEPPPLEIPELRQALERILSSTGNRVGTWGILAVSLDRGDTLLALNQATPLVPASNQKLLTTVAALHVLGPDFTYDTFLLTDGAVSGDVVEGNLILYGTGDPTLSRRFFGSETAPMDTLARQVAEAGIHLVRGDLIVDGSYFSGPDIHPDWDPGDLNDPFAAPVSAVAFNENVVTLRVEAGLMPGLPPTIHTLPPGSGLPVVTTAITASPGTRSRVWLFRETPQDPIGIEGEIPVGGPDVWRQLPVPDPLLFAGWHFQRALETHGVRVGGEVVTVRDPIRSALFTRMDPERPGGPSPPKIIGLRRSTPLIEILRVVNKESHNLLAETVLKTLGRQIYGVGAFAGVTRALERFLTREVVSNGDEVVLRDGSGLSPRNRVSARAVVEVLDFAAAQPTWDAFLSTLPEAGIRRELGRMRGSPAARNLRAKTGTMEGVSALSGIVRTRSGERILFSIISNGVASESRAKRAEDQLGIRFASLTRPREINGPSDR